MVSPCIGTVGSAQSRSHATSVLLYIVYCCDRTVAGVLYNVYIHDLLLRYTPLLVLLRHITVAGVLYIAYCCDILLLVFYTRAYCCSILLLVFYTIAYCCSILLLVFYT